MKQVTPIKKDKFKAAIDEFRRAMPAAIEQVKLTAQLRKISYDACIKEGFTPEQALELAKNPMNLT